MHLTNTSKRRSKPRSELDTSYYNSNIWRCLLSPTGAHHWLIEALKQGGYLHTCCYCDQSKEVHCALMADGRVNEEVEA